MRLPGRGGSRSPNRPGRLRRRGRRTAPCCDRSVRHMAQTVVEIETPHGLARAHLHAATKPRAALVLGHGAGGGVEAPDLVRARDVALERGLTVALVEQPYRVAGRRSPAPAAQLDAAWTAVVEALAESHLSGLAARRRRPLRGSPGRVPNRQGDRRRRRPLSRVPTRAPSADRDAYESATGARCGRRPDARGPGRERTASESLRRLLAEPS